MNDIKTQVESFFNENGRINRESVPDFVDLQTSAKFLVELIRYWAGKVTIFCNDLKLDEEEGMWKFYWKQPSGCSGCVRSVGMLNDIFKASDNLPFVKFSGNRQYFFTFGDLISYSEGGIEGIEKYNKQKGEMELKEKQESNKRKEEERLNELKDSEWLKGSGLSIKEAAFLAKASVGGILVKCGDIVVNAKQRFDTKIEGSNVIDDIVTEVVIGFGDKIYDRGFFGRRRWRSTYGSGPNGSLPSALAVKSYELVDGNFTIVFSEEDGGIVKATLKVGEYVEMSDEVREKLEKAIREFHKSEEENTNVLIPRHQDQIRHGRSLAQAGISSIPVLPRGDGARKGKVQLSTIQFEGKENATFTLSHEMISAVAENTQYRIVDYTAELVDSEVKITKKGER